MLLHCFLVLLAFQNATGEGSFFRRGGGIDVGTHSKRNRTSFIFPILLKGGDNATEGAEDVEEGASFTTTTSTSTNSPERKKNMYSSARLKVKDHYDLHTRT